MGLRWNCPTFSHRENVSTINTLGNTIFRRALDGRAFRNDPDVFLLRENNMHCTFEQREIIATVNKLFGSVLFTSDNVGDYNAQQMQLLLKTFAKDDIQVQRAGVPVVCAPHKSISITLKTGIQKHFSFDMDKGKMIL